jgi:hypothetical protein
MTSVVTKTYLESIAVDGPNAPEVVPNKDPMRDAAEVFAKKYNVAFRYYTQDSVTIDGQEFVAARKREAATYYLGTKLSVDEVTKLPGLPDWQRENLVSNLKQSGATHVVSSPGGRISELGPNDIVISAASLAAKVRDGDPAKTLGV